jgi:class 3 adenylate cyclase
MNDRFKQLLLRFSHELDDDNRKLIEEELWEDYGTENAVMVIDMSGFSLLSQTYGIVHYLSMISRMHLITEPLIKEYNGQVIKFEADNCFAVFSDPTSAVLCSLSLNQAFGEINEFTPKEMDIHISCGIDYGSILVVDEKDLYGNAVNRASKLGEDLAKTDQILITKEVKEKLSCSDQIWFEEYEFTVSGIDITAYSVLPKQAREGHS